MDKYYSASFADLQDYSSQHQGYELMKPPPARQMLITGEAHHEEDNAANNNNTNNTSMEHFLLHNHNPNNVVQSASSPSAYDKLMSFADVMQFADFGPKLALNHHKPAGNSMEDPVYFLKFPVLNDRMMHNNNNHIEERRPQQQQLLMMSSSPSAAAEAPLRFDDYVEGAAGEEHGANTTGAASEVQLQFGGAIIKNQQAGSGSVQEGAAAAAKNNSNNKRKRAPRSIKTSEEVESQRMTHIAVERNRRKQMNEHLRVLRSLMPGSYVQRGDQASIIGGAIEFVRELEQLLQCLESQKRRRLYGESGPPAANSIQHHQVQVLQQPSSAGAGFFPEPPPLLQNGDDDEAALVSFESSVGMREEMAENKSCLADVEVKVLGFDAMIKVLSRRRPGQLIQAIAALEDLQLNILHTNITTIEQTVLYSFNAKVESEGRFTAEEIASSVQQIFTFIHANGGGGAAVA